MTIENAIGALASALSLDAAELTAQLKNGDDWKDESETSEILSNIISTNFQTARKGKADEVTRKATDKFNAFAKSVGYEIPAGSKYPESLGLFKTWLDEQKSDQPEPGKKPEEMTEAELSKLPAFKKIVDARLQAIAAEKDALQAEFDTFKKTKEKETVEVVGQREALAILEEKKAIFEAKDVPKDKRLKAYFKTLDFSNVRIGADKKPYFVDADGEPLVDEKTGRPVSFESVVLDEWTYGFHTVDPNKGGPQPGGSPAGGKDQNGKITFASAADHAKFMATETDPKKLQAALEWQMENLKE